MSISLHVTPDGKQNVVQWDHRDLANRLGGSITFVGAVESCNVVVVGLVDASGFEVNEFAALHPDVFMKEAMPVRGPIVFVGSDDDGEEMDVDIDGLAGKLMNHATPPSAVSHHMSEATR